jgi:hypothetical protein
MALEASMGDTGLVAAVAPEVDSLAALSQQTAAMMSSMDMVLHESFEEEDAGTAHDDHWLDLDAGPTDDLELADQELASGDGDGLNMMRWGDSMEADAEAERHRLGESAPDQVGGDEQTNSRTASRRRRNKSSASQVPSALHVRGVAEVSYSRGELLEIGEHERCHVPPVGLTVCCAVSGLACCVGGVPTA